MTAPELRIPLERLHGLRGELRRRSIDRSLWPDVVREAEDMWQRDAPVEELDAWLDQLEINRPNY